MCVEHIYAMYVSLLDSAGVYGHQDGCRDIVFDYFSQYYCYYYCCYYHCYLKQDFSLNLELVIWVN